MTPDVSNYTVSIHYDRRLYKQDIAGSIAHAKMLARQGIIPQIDSDTICRGLFNIKVEIEENTFPWDPSLEDIHMNIEARLKANIGPVAGKLHTARSRNDQAALDLRLYTKEVTKETIQKISELQVIMLNQAEAHQTLVIPGYTHLQRAQPVLLAHHFLSYFEMLQRDRERFQKCHAAADVLPLGSGALAGVPYPVDRNHLASELGFTHISANSMDAVSDRDYVVEYLSAAAICMMHISRLAEEIVLWSSQEFEFITLDDQFTTGSSIMPQKRNPDFAELARGKTGRIYGHLIAILTMLKGLPLTYNRDLQEDKEGFFDTVDTLLSTLQMFTHMMDSIAINTDSINKSLEKGNMLSTDIADYLVDKGLPFREAHGLINRIANYAQQQKKEIHDLSLAEYKEFSHLFDETIFKISFVSSIEARDIPGGTSPRQVNKALAEARQRIEVSNNG